ncbi:MAG TPA: protein BmrU [Candidatus Gemmiger faecigallinarum]|nr:protein BmrU [Candidatus Gemmiger faecigallinarum]
MKRLFVINPVAGPRNPAETLRPRILAAAADTADEIEVMETTHPGHARELTERLAHSSEPVCLYACGGDGTFNEMVQAAVGHPNLSVGCVPCGSGNDFVRNFGPKEAFLDIPGQLAATSYPIDTIHTEYGYSAAICAAGLDAKVAYGIPKYKRLPLCGGSMAYSLSIVEAFFSPLGHPLRIQLDDTVLEGDYMMTAICNGRVYGGGYTAGPHALLDDGLLDVVLVKPVPRIRMPGFLAKYKVGRHLQADDTVSAEFRPYMTFRRVKEVSMQTLDGRPLIVTLDGECAPRTELHARVCEKNLSVLLPAGLAAGQLPFVRR